MKICSNGHLKLSSLTVMQMAINNWTYNSTHYSTDACTTLFNVHCLLFRRTGHEKTKYSASEQRRATLRNTLLDNERLVLEKQKLVLEIEVLQETKEVMILKKSLLLNQINQYTTVYTTES